MKNFKKPDKKIIIILSSFLLLFAAGFILYDGYTYQSTDDAYVENLYVQLAPKVRGEIKKVYVEDNQYVNKGDLIAEIDDRDYLIEYNQAKAQYEKALYAQKNAKARLKAVNTELNTAKEDVSRYSALYKEGAISKQTLDNAISKQETYTANQVQATQAVLSDKQNNVANAEIDALRAQMERAELNLEYTKIYAPESGTVSNKRIMTGTYIQAGSPMLSIVPDEVWIVANFKENQVGKMKPNQEVIIKIDSYPNVKFKGKIDSIQRLSGAKSSLFPPENAVGSFVKIVQRIPVKITFDELPDKTKYNIIPGMSVVPKVKVR